MSHVCVYSMHDMAVWCVGLMCGLLETKAEGDNQNEDVDLKHTNEEFSEVVKHFCEEIPEEPKIGSQIWDQEAAER